MAKDSGLQRGAPQEWQRQQRAPSPAATSGGTVGAVPTHFHSAGAIVSGQFADERMPDRLSDPAYYEAVDADRQIFSGFWSAHITTSNMPAGAQWACQTIRSGADQSSYWLTQTAHEVGGAYRIYRRVLDAGTWTAWEQIDRTFYDTRYAAGQGLYLPTRMAGQKWRTKRAAVLAGLERGHIAILGDSIAYGAAATGTTPPKAQTSYPGRLRAILEAEGRWGGGWVICDANSFNNPTWDPRWAFGGTVTAPVYSASGSFGFHRSATYKIATGAASYVEFTDVMDKVQIWTAQGSSGLYSVSIDGVAAGTVGNGGGVGSIAKVTDADATAYAPSQEVTVEINCGALASHTVRITSPAAADTFLLGVKPIVSGLGKFEVSNPSISSKSLFSLWSATAGHNDETNGLYGLPLIDLLKADLLIVALGINDWQFPRTLAATQTDVATLLARQTSSGTAPTGAVKANGDAMLLWNPQPNLSTIGTSSPDSWPEWYAGWYDSATAAGVPLLNLGERWVDFATADAAGLLADDIHPNDDGSLDMVSVIHEAVMHGI